MSAPKAGGAAPRPGAKPEVKSFDVDVEFGQIELDPRRDRRTRTVEPRLARPRGKCSGTDDAIALGMLAVGALLVFAVIDGLNAGWLLGWLWG